MTDDERSHDLHVAWTLRDMVWASVAAAAFVAIGLALTAGAVAVLYVLDGSEMNITLWTLLVFALEAVIIVPAWLWGPSKHGGGWRSLGFRRFKLPQTIGLLILGMALILLVNPLWEITRQELGLPAQPDVLPLLGGGFGGLVLALALGGVVAPLAEEVFFRGYLYAGLRERFGKGWALVASAAIFTVVHFTPGVFPPIFVIGLVLAGLYEITGSLWPSIALHAAVNSLAFIGMYLADMAPAAGI
jgi:membrane protease YdiL (CAAX protease family)